MHNQSFAQIWNWAKSWSDASVRWFIRARAAVSWSEGRKRRGRSMTWLSWRTALSALSDLSGHNFHSQAASSQWRRLSKYKPHSYSVYAVTLHIARGSRAVPSPSAFHVRSGTNPGTSSTGNGSQPINYWILFMHLFSWHGQTPKHHRNSEIFKS